MMNQKNNGTFQTPYEPSENIFKDDDDSRSKELTRILYLCVCLEIVGIGIIPPIFVGSIYLYYLMINNMI